jgi:hypothetical protein
MRRLVVAVPVCLLLSIAISARADDDAKNVLEQAVKAHGGAENISKHKDQCVIQKGKMHVSVMGMEIDGTMEISASKDRFRQEFQFSLMGQDYTQSVVFDGKQIFVVFNGKVVFTTDKKEDLDLVNESMYAEKAAGLALLGDKSIEVSIIGDDMVGDTPVVGVRVSKKGHKDVNLYFDKSTHLLKKTQFRSLDFQSHAEVDEERIMEEYADVGGEKQPKRVIVSKDGKKFGEIEFTEFNYVDKLDDSLFTKPK